MIFDNTVRIHLSPVSSGHQTPWAVKIKSFLCHVSKKINFLHMCSMQRGYQEQKFTANAKKNHWISNKGVARLKTTCGSPAACVLFKEHVVENTFTRLFSSLVWAVFQSNPLESTCCFFLCAAPVTIFNLLYWTLLFFSSYFHLRIMGLRNVMTHKITATQSTVIVCESTLCH